MPLADFTAPYKQAFFEDLDTLRIKRADAFSGRHGTTYIEAMIAMIEKLIARGLAYQAEDKSVYFRLTKFPDYGKLAHFNLDELRPTGRMQNDEYEKEHIGDFALWKAWDEADGDVAGESHGDAAGPAGTSSAARWRRHCSGRTRYPLRRRGQHLPASRSGDRAERMLHRKEVRPLLAALRAPHGRRAEDVEVARQLLHAARSAREGLHRTRDALRAHAGELSRAAELHWDGMEEARAALARIDEWLRGLREAARRKEPSERLRGHHGKQFEEALDNDLKFLARSVFFSNRFAKRIASWIMGTLAADAASAGWNGGNESITVLAFRGGRDGASARDRALAEERVQARLAKDFRKSDQLRDELGARGWDVRDTKDGQKITRRSDA